MFLVNDGTSGFPRDTWVWAFWPIDSRWHRGYVLEIDTDRGWLVHTEDNRIAFYTRDQIKKRVQRVNGKLQETAA